MKQSNIISANKLSFRGHFYKYRADHMVLQNCLPINHSLLHAVNDILYVFMHTEIHLTGAVILLLI